jgi:hypothetical protein
LEEKKDIMKKLLIAALLFASTGAMAQKFQLGLKGGANISNFTQMPINDVKKSAIVSFVGGGFINFMIGDNFSIQPEALFTTQGVKIDSGAGNANYKVNYLSIPVMAKLKFNSGLFIEAGPQVSFKLGEDVPNSNIDNFAKNLDLAVGAGLGYHGKSGFGLGARYLAGLSKVGDYSETALRNPDFKNSGVQIYAFLALFNNRR